MNSILLAILLASAAPTVEVQPLDGPALTGTLVELSVERVAIKTRQGQVTLPADKLLTVSPGKAAPAAPAAPGIGIELVDGSVLRARQYVTQGDRAQITLSGGQVVPAPTSAVRLVQLQQDTATAAEWSRLVKQKVDSDLLIFRAEGTIDSHQGVLHDVTEDAVRFDLEGDVLPVKRAKVYGFVYRHSDTEKLPAAVCRITDTAGSQWAVRSLNLGERLQWTTAAGVVVSQPLANVAEIDFSGDKVAYLSDLKPDSFAWSPYFATEKTPAALVQFYTPRFDRGFDSRLLRLGETPYRKGLALASRTELVYRLPDGYRRLRAVSGIEEAVRPRGNVRLVVRGDDKVLLETPITGSDAPRMIDLDIEGVRRLRIVVDFGGSLTAGGRLLLCNARIMK